MTIGSIEGMGRVNLGSKQLLVGTNNLSTAYAGTISGDAISSLEKVGTGTLSLTGANTYTGATLVTDGQLNVDGSIATSSLTTVNAGGILSGNGTVSNATINGGTLAPGNAVAALNVNGSLTFTSAASYLVEVSPAQASRVNVTGMATLGGASLKARFNPGTYVSKQYTIVDAAGGINGTFGNYTTSNLPTNFRSSLSYDGTHAYLNLALSFKPDYGSGLNGNQQAVANALTGYFNTNGHIPMVYGMLTPTGLSMAAGELATAPQQTTFEAMGLFMGLMMDPTVAGRTPMDAPTALLQFADDPFDANAYVSRRVRSSSERDAYATMYTKARPTASVFEPRWSVWSAGFGGSQTTDGNAAAGSNSTTSRIFGGAVGADYRFSPDTVAGFAMAGGGTNFVVTNGFGGGRSDLFQTGAFVRHTNGAAYITAALAYSWQDITTNRIVGAGGGDQLRAEFNANAYSGRVEGGYRFAMTDCGLTPYAAGQFMTFDLPGYSERAISGPGPFALAYSPKSATDPRSELGLRSDKTFAMSDSLLTLRGRLAWAHDYDPARSIAATFVALPGASFVVNGAAQAHDSALTTASLEMKWRNGWAAAATFEGEFSNITNSYAGKAVIRHVW